MKGLSISPSNSNIVRKNRALNLDLMARWASRFRVWVAILLVLLLANILTSLVIVNPMYRLITAGQESLESTRSKINQLLQYKKAREDLISLDRAFLTQQDLARLADRLPSMAKRHGLLLPAVSYQEDRQKEAGFRKITLNFNLNGQYANIRRFIHEVESLDLFLYIQDMAIGSSAGESGQLNLRVRMVAVLR